MREYISSEGTKIFIWVAIFFCLLLALLQWLRTRNKQKLEQRENDQLIKLNRLTFKYPALEQLFKPDQTMDVSAKFEDIDHLNMPDQDKEFVKQMLIKGLTDDIIQQYKKRTI